MKKLELNPREYKSLETLMYQKNLNHLLTPKYVLGIVIILLPLDLALSLGF
jgi:hypothetical protein